MMLTEIFLKILDMSLTASAAIVIVLFLRLLLKRAPKVLSYALWGIVLFRLLCPVTIQSDFSLFGIMYTPYSVSGTMEYIAGNNNYNDYPETVLAAEEYAKSENFALREDQGEESTQETFITIAAYIWLGGIVLLALRAWISYRHLRQKLITASPLRDNIYLVDEITSPFVMGLIKPKIYLPSSLNEQEQAYTISHEKHHLKRFDHFFKAVAFAALCIHWFNPLVWLAFNEASKDMEMSCDEAVIKQMGDKILADYAASLLSLATGRQTITGTPLAFGEGDTKGRIRNLAKWRKPARWVIIGAVVLCAVLAVGLLTDPEENREFTMKSTGIYGLENELILEKIAQAEHLEDPSLINVNADNFDILLNADFSWANDGAIRFFYEKEQETYCAQLRMFTEENKYFITETAPWSAQLARFKLSDYLSALKYLPQEEIRALSLEADAYDIWLETEGAPADYERVITYDQTGVKPISGWFIHLRIEPLHGENGTYNGSGDEVIHVFYGRESDGELMVVH